jgi:hypothetical protein
MRYQGKIVQGQAMEDCVTEEPDLVAAIMDGFHGDIKAFEILSRRQR